MPIELRMLVYSALLLVVVIFVQASAAVRKVGLREAAGNRDDLPAPGGFAGRAKRTAANHIENLVVFAPLILTAVVAGKAGATTALAAQLFFWGRLVHAVIYLAGLPLIRTVAFMVSTAGILLVALVDLGVLS